MFLPVSYRGNLHSVKFPLPFADQMPLAQLSLQLSHGDLPPDPPGMVPETATRYQAFEGNLRPQRLRKMVHFTQTPTRRRAQNRVSSSKQALTLALAWILIDPNLITLVPCSYPGRQPQFTVNCLPRPVCLDATMLQEPPPAAAHETYAELRVCPNWHHWYRVASCCCDIMTCNCFLKVSRCRFLGYVLGRCLHFQRMLYMGSSIF
ncbi:Uncharacterized protein HZ326_16548 [Fusarium oxysporum f. sp. albedinis]|nr:Uncharacterized protein HZ326_16548 [Fusarium oxysporum f. sp. albedinis]